MVISINKNMVNNNNKKRHLKKSFKIPDTIREKVVTQKQQIETVICPLILTQIKVSCVKQFVGINWIVSY